MQFRNNVEIHGKGLFHFLRLVSLPLQVIPWWKSRDALEKCLNSWGGFWVYGGSRHFALIHGGKAVLKVKDRGW